MNELHLFAGAGGGILGGHLLGHTCVCAVEIEPYCRKVLLQRQRDGVLPRFPIWDDVTTFDGQPWRGKVDIICGGFPCQDISAAGKGQGIAGSRSGLWSEFARIIGEVRPKYVFVENSPLLRSRGLYRVLGDLARMGYDARWGVLGADDVGAPQHRKRIWILANSRHLCGGTGPSQANRKSPRLQDAVKMWATPTARDWKEQKLSPALARVHANPKKSRQLPRQMSAECPELHGGQLNPMWVEWLMGWPLGWTGLEPLAMDKYQQWLQLHSEFSEESSDED